MTTYKGLKGKTVQNYTTDPTDIEAEGQLFYNSTSGTFKTALGSYGTWSSGGNLPAVRSAAGATGTQNATILAFGEVTGPPTFSNNALTYNGTSWTSVANGNTSRTALGATGTVASALFFGGEIPGGVSTATELWNGSTWTSNPTGLSTPRSRLGGNGTQAAALASGGFNNTTQVNATEEWSGIVATTKTVTVS